MTSKTHFVFIFILGLYLSALPSISYGEPTIMMSSPSAHQFSFSDIDGNELNLSDYNGKVVLVVNTASTCGFTPQYEGLQSLHDTYAEQGLVVLAVPSGDFGDQEYGSEEEVKEFTEKEFSVSFQLTGITNVKGSDRHPFYKWAGEEAGVLGRPKWNFHKYLIDGNGQFVKWYSSTTSPTASKVTKAIEEQLKKLPQNTEL